MQFCSAGGIIKFCRDGYVNYHFRLNHFRLKKKQTRTREREATPKTGAGSKMKSTAKKEFILLLLSLFCSLPHLKINISSETNLIIARRIRNSENPGLALEKERLLSALGLNSGDLEQTAQYLGIRTEELNLLISRYGLESKLERINEIVRALELNQGVIRRAAEQLGRSAWGLRVEIYRLYLQKTVIDIQKRVHEILTAIGKAQGNLRQAAQDLGLGRSTTRLDQEFSKYNLREEVRDLFRLIDTLKTSGGNITRAAEILDKPIGTIQTRLYRYQLRPLMYELKKEREEIIIALGTVGGNIEKAARSLGISLSKLGQLITNHNLQPEIDKIIETVDALTRTRGSYVEAAGLLGVDQVEVANRVRSEFHLYKVISDIKLRVEDILSALGKSGGDLEKAAQELGMDVTTLSSLITTYGLENEANEIKTLFDALKDSNWNFAQAARNLEISYQELTKKVNRYYLRLSANEEKEKILYALAQSEGDVARAAQLLEISETELTGLIESNQLQEKLRLIQNMLQAYKNSRGNLRKAAASFDKTTEWFRQTTARLYLYPALFKIDARIEDLIEILGKSQAELNKATQELGIEVEEIEELIALYGLSHDLQNIRDLVSGLKRASGVISELARESGFTTETVRINVLRYYLAPFRFQTQKEVEEILIALGTAGGHLDKASQLLDIPPEELEALINIYGLQDELADLRSKAGALEKAQGVIADARNPTLNPTDISTTYLQHFIYDIQDRIEQILYAIGMNGGDLEKASQSMGSSLKELENLIAGYNLNSDLEMIRNIISALEETAGNISAAADRLGLSQSRLSVLINRYYLNLKLLEIRKRDL